MNKVALREANAAAAAAYSQKVQPATLRADSADFLPALQALRGDIVNVALQTGARPRKRSGGAETASAGAR